MTEGFAAPFAAIYDRYFSGNVATASRVIHGFHRQVSDGTNPRLLDLCCGTGQLASFFAGNGYSVVGVDASAAMLDRAAHRCASSIETGDVRLIHAEATDFVLDGQVDLATCTSDSLNHLPDLDSLTRAFSAVRQAMVPGGYFVFDIHSMLGLSLQNFAITREADDVLIVIRAIPDLSANRVLARVTGCRRLDDSQLWERFEQQAWITAWPAADVLGALADAGFAKAWPCHLEDLSLPLTDPDSEPRLYFLARG